MTENRRPTVLVLFGGRSSEHQISCATAAGVLQTIDRQKWDVIPVGITPDGQWYEQPDEPSRYQISDGKGYTVTASAKRVGFLPGNSDLMQFSVNEDGSLVEGSGTSLGSVDVVLPLLHGPFGEDGTLQGMLELSNVRYVGCGVTASAISMDKHLTKTVLAAAGISVGNWKLVTPRTWRADRNSVLADLQALGLPAFVKPCRAGSSMGITRVTDQSEMEAAIEKAMSHDPRVIVESATAGREVECGVLQLPTGELIASPLGEIIVNNSDFYDYEAKYFDQDAVSLSCPADLADSASKRIQESALEAFVALEGEGLSRVDFFYNPETDEYTVNEVNTLPGFTPFSMYPTLLQEAGISYSDLIDTLLEEALSRPIGLR